MEWEEAYEYRESTETNELLEFNTAIQTIEPVWPILPLNLKRYFPTSESESYEFENFEVSPDPEEENELFQAQKLYFRDVANRTKQYLCLIIIYGHSSHEEACKEALRISWHRNWKKTSSKAIMGLIIDEEKQAWFRGSHTDETYIKKMGSNWVANNECMLRTYFRTFRRALRRHAPSPGFDPAFESGSESELNSVIHVLVSDKDVVVSDVVVPVRPGSASGHDQLSARTDSYDDSDEPDVDPGLFEWDLNSSLPWMFD
ncbi:hypothetical protein AnigIFM63326_008203 [Aspergillus niger]|nr:hypothetical protein AnigIFM63326_008203 [Aspergillus niger]